MSEEWDLFMEYQRGEHDPNSANMDTPYTPNLPYRIAMEMQEHIQQMAATSDYTLGRAEREDIAHDYALHLIDQNAVEPHSVAFDGLIQWRRMYGN